MSYRSGDLFYDTLADITFWLIEFLFAVISKIVWLLIAGSTALVQYLLHKRSTQETERWLSLLDPDEEQEDSTDSGGFILGQPLDDRG